MEIALMELFESCPVFTNWKHHLHHMLTLHTRVCKVWDYVYLSLIFLVSVLPYDQKVNLTFFSLFSFLDSDSAVAKRWETAPGHEWPFSRQPLGPAGSTRDPGHAADWGWPAGAWSWNAVLGRSLQKWALQGKGKAPNHGIRPEVCLFFCHLLWIFCHMFFIKNNFPLPINNIYPVSQFKP